MLSELRTVVLAYTNRLGSAKSRHSRLADLWKQFDYMKFGCVPVAAGQGAKYSTRKLMVGTGNKRPKAVEVVLQHFNLFDGC